MPKPTVPTADKVADKWADVTPGRSSYYEENTPPAAEKWQSNTILAAPTYKTAVSAANIGKRFSGGVREAGSEKFGRKVKDVGVGRFGPGITAAKADYRKGIEWVLSSIAAVDLPTRKPRGDPGNKARVSAIFDALHKARLARLGAGVSAS